MIIWGFRAITRTQSHGDFHCPRCAITVNYLRKQVTRWFTLYFIPVFPREMVADFVECQKCQGAFTAETLTYDPETERERFEAAYLNGMKRVMVQMMMADGQIAPAEKQLLRGMYKSLANQDLTDEAIDKEVQSLRSARGDILGYLRQLGASLNESGKMQVLRAAHMVATADGTLELNEGQLLVNMAGALGVSQQQFNAVFGASNPRPH